MTSRLRRICAATAAALALSAGIGASPAAATSQRHCVAIDYGSIWTPVDSYGTVDCRINQWTPDNNPAVRALQYALNTCYGEGLLIDGDFGPVTSAALSRAQAQEGIIVDGWYGNQTAYNIEFYPSCEIMFP